MSANRMLSRKPMSTGKGLSATETRAYARGVAAAKREREDALTTIIRELEAERDVLKAQNAELVEALRGVLSDITQPHEFWADGSSVSIARAVLSKASK